MDSPIPPPNDASPSFSMLQMVLLDDAISYTFMCRNKRFMLDIAAENLEGAGILVDELYRFKDGQDDPDVFREFEEWAVDAIDEQVKRVVEARGSASKAPTSLLDYYGAETFYLTLVNCGGVLEGVQSEYDPESHGGSSPRIMVVDSDASTASRATLDQPPTIPRQSLPSVPFLPASHLVRAAGPDSFEEDLCEVPRVVRHVNTGREYFFKAADDRRSFTREVEILGRLRDLDLRTSRIAGLVYYDGEEAALLGMLLERIEGDTLAFARISAPAADKRKWTDQIDETVRALHVRGVVWGDARPENVTVSSSGDAVVVDFGGGWSPGYVDPELAETGEGDLQGLGRLREELLGGT